MRAEIRSGAAFAGVVAALLLVACGDKPQAAKAASNKADGKPWEDSATAFNAPGYQGGDRARWEQQLRNRAQAQNDYAAGK